MTHLKRTGTSYESTLSPEQLQALHAMLREDRLTYPQMSAQAPAWPDGRKPSAQVLSRIYARLKKADSQDQLITSMLDRAEQIAQIRQQLSRKISAGDNEALTDEILHLLGESVLQATAAGRTDKEITMAINSLLTRSSQHHEREKFKEALRSKIKAGLDALAESIKGNAVAMEAFAQIQATVQEVTQ